MQDCRRAAERAGYVNAIAGAGARAKNGFARGNVAGNNNISHDFGCRRDVSAGKLNVEAPGQIEKPTQEAINPQLGEFWRQSKRQETCHRRTAHSGNVTQSAGQTTVADAGRGMPLAAKVDVFYGEIGRDQELATAWWLKNGAIVANALHHWAGSRGRPGQLPDAFNQSPFSHDFVKA